MILMFVCVCKIFIGSLVFDYAAKVNINYSLQRVTQTCTIVQPRSVQFKNADVNKQIKEGDRVVVQIGYRNDFGSDNLGLRTEFVGYVTSEGIDTPVTFSCEDEMYKLKKGPLSKNYPNGVTLKQLLKDIAPGYAYDVEDVNLGPYTIEEATPAQILQDLAEQGIYCYFAPPTAVPYNGLGTYVPVLRGGMQYRTKYRRVLLSTGKNLLNTSNLGWEHADADRLVIKAVSNQKGGGKLVAYYPATADRSKASVFSRNFYNISLDELKRRAEQEYKKHVKEGYIGTLPVLGVPLITMGDVAYVENTLYPDNNADYIIDSVDTEFGDNGFRRTVTLGGLASNIKRA